MSATTHVLSSRHRGRRRAVGRPLGCRGGSKCAAYEAGADTAALDGCSRHQHLRAGTLATDRKQHSSVGREGCRMPLMGCNSFTSL